MKSKRFSLFTIIALFALSGGHALACTACFGQSDSMLAQGMNMGILTLLVVILGVLGGVASFFIYLARRSARFPQPGTELNQQFSENRTKA